MRFKYETPGFLRRAAIGISAPHRWRTNVRPWIFDSHSGIRFQLTEGEEAVIKCLAGCVARRGPSASTDSAFDYLADAIVRRRLGYVPEEAILYPYLSGLEYLQLTGRLRGLPGVWLFPVQLT